MGQNISASPLQRPLINPKEIGVCRSSHQEQEHNLSVHFSNALTSVGRSSKLCALGECEMDLFSERRRKLF